ncbi:hypothetical protein BB559_001570 [Furculomyces boomerangus]|uniref:Nuclear transport factor 2 n=2 Tax=Harpellales TaxID=61421 RepID=A0A2T9XYF7_9FUNG|nr:hypothetical protein BB559_007207 [Furculomyces boomerangus]PVU98441.1 hypothetical protein BB559_001570 [Furculomyces boomerangus]PWA01064.1 hypothetical protein BB558_002850 [Smittium angustum]
MATSMEQVSKEFTAFYYNTFDANRADLRPLYRAGSMLTFEGQQFMGLDSIMEKLQGLSFQKVAHQISTCEFQPSNPQMSSIIILVTGFLLIDNEQHPHQFSQVFQLSMDNGSWFVQNDIFRFIFA